VSRHNQKSMGSDTLSSGRPGGRHFGRHGFTPSVGRTELGPSSPPLASSGKGPRAFPLGPLSESKPLAHEAELRDAPDSKLCLRGLFVPLRPAPLRCVESFFPGGGYTFTTFWRDLFRAGVRSASLCPTALRDLREAPPGRGAHPASPSQCAGPSIADRRPCRLEKCAGCSIETIAFGLEFFKDLIRSNPASMVNQVRTLRITFEGSLLKRPFHRNHGYNPRLVNRSSADFRSSGN